MHLCASCSARFMNLKCVGSVVVGVGFAIVDWILFGGGGVVVEALPPQLDTGRYFMCLHGMVWVGMCVHTYAMEKKLLVILLEGDMRIDGLN